jgi:hypothetical protein
MNERRQPEKAVKVDNVPDVGRWDVALRPGWDAFRMRFNLVRKEYRE